TAGLKITSVGEAANAIQGRPSQIQFLEKIGRTTARDLGLVTGAMSYQTTSRQLPAGPYTGPLTFDVNANGQTTSITVNPAAPMGVDELAAALNSEINIALRAQSMFDFTVAVNGVDADGDLANDSLSFDISDASGTASFELVGTNPASLPLGDAIQNGTLSGSPSFTQNPGSFTNGVFAGRDLNPALTLSTGISALNGGEGFQLEVDAAGNPLAPQGLRITNGSLSANVDLARILNNPNATLGDLINQINGAGVQVEARIASSGDRIEIVSKLVGVPMTVENVNGSIATQLGVDSRFSEMRTVDLNGGRGLTLDEGADFKAIATDGTAVNFDLGDADTVAGVINAINNNSANVQADGSQLFTAKAVTERTFETLSLSNVIMAPGVSPTFQVSLNGSDVRTIDLGGPHTSLDSLATAMQSELNRVANQLGMDGFSVRVNGNNASGRIDFQIQDEDGPAEIDFTGGFTTT
ncbi:MAG: hypothetical protein KDB07_10535, partial [Planctomycetes bacterium]|nr:hypothetical protein [Planctomycetota bacterium]